MKQRVCLLTGATSGIGRSGAISLAKLGYELWLTARSDAKAAETQRQIIRAVPNAQIRWLYGDFSRLTDIRRIASEFNAQSAGLDLLWLNAGLCHNKRVLSHDGYEMMLAVNHLAPFLLTQLLFDRLCESGDARVVVTASGAYKAVKSFNIDDINFDRGFKTFTAYGNSKLANILFTQALARKLQQASPSGERAVNCFHPGFVGTGIGTQVWLGKAVMALCKPFVRSPEKGAQTGLYLATDPSIAGHSGGYYYDCKKQSLPPYARDEKMAEMLWAASAEMVGFNTK